MGYAAGLLRGWDLGKKAGRLDADQEAATAWAGVARHVRLVAGRPTHDELEKRRRSCPVTPFPSRQQCRVSWTRPSDDGQVRSA